MPLYGHELSPEINPYEAGLGIFVKLDKPCLLYKSEKILCPKRGLVSPGEHCRSFRYDPLKRVPPVPAAPDFSRLRCV